VTRDPIVLAALGVLAVLAVALVVALLRTLSRTRRELDAAHVEAARLRAQVEEIERVLASPGPTSPRPAAEYTITALGGSGEAQAPPRVDQALFADLVLRETVVKAASLAHGVRRALAPESRNRIRFEVRREIRRSRKQRRADLRDARRDWEARQRAGLTDDEDAA
jgi:hypothetical protein